MLTAAGWLVFNLFGMLLPVGAGWLLLSAEKLPASLGTFADAGQFAIYSAGMWVTTYYLIVKPSWSRLIGTPVLGFSHLAGFTLSLLLFVLGSRLSSGADINPEFVRWPSVLLYFASAIVCFLAVAFDEYRMATDPRSALLSQQDELRESFRSTEPKRGSNG